MGTGLLILHGGGEAMPGDEPTALEALELASASRGAASRDGDEASPIEVAIPAKEKGMVTIETGPKAADVTVKITGK